MTNNIDVIMNKQLRANNTVPSVSTLWWLIMQSQGALWYNLNARKSIDRDEPWFSLCSCTLAAVFPVKQLARAGLC